MPKQQQKQKTQIYLRDHKPPLLTRTLSLPRSAGGLSSSLSLSSELSSSELSSSSLSDCSSDSLDSLDRTDTCVSTAADKDKAEEFSFIYLNLNKISASRLPSGQNPQHDLTSSACSSWVLWPEPAQHHYVSGTDGSGMPITPAVSVPQNAANTVLHQKHWGCQSPHQFQPIRRPQILFCIKSTGGANHPSSFCQIRTLQILFCIKSPQQFQPIRMLHCINSTRGANHPSSFS